MDLQNEKCVMVIDEHLPLGIIANTAAIMGITLGKKMPEEVLGHPLYQVFPQNNKKLLAAYTDVAVNGKSYHLQTYSVQLQKQLILKCFQPMENFCACILVPADDFLK